MVEIIPDVPDNVIAIRARGTVTASDYESVIIPAIESKLARHDKLRILYHLGSDFSGFEARAVWHDAKVGLEHFGAWERLAVVSDVEWVRGVTRLFGVAIPGRVRVYRNAELDSALAWAREAA
ncbi:MAG TPA: STAS/SEC14 domain-containing protein [Candidatus Binatia bacterium]|nr:STAS/SEC14 domain-containing protein [Candidatus Binatia bacterium]